MPDYESEAQRIVDENKRATDEQLSPMERYGDAAEQVVGAQKVRLNNSLIGAEKVNADRRAKALAMAQSANLPVDMVERNMEAVQQQIRTSDWQRAKLSRNHPELAQWIQNPENANVSNDDLPAMRAIDVAARALNGEDPNGILPHGFVFGHDGIIEPLESFKPNFKDIADGNDHQGTKVYRSFSELHSELVGRGQDDEAYDMKLRYDAEKRYRQWGFMVSVQAGMEGSVRSTYRAAGFSDKVLQSWGVGDKEEADRVQEISQQLSPGFWGDVQRGTGGVIADLPAMMTGGALVSGLSNLSKVGKANKAVNVLLQATAKGQGAQGAARLQGLRVAAAKELDSAAKASPFLAAAAGIGKQSKAIVYGAEAAKVALSSQPLAIREGVLEGRDHGAANGAMSWLIETAVPGAFGRTGAEKYLVKGATNVVADGWRGVFKRGLVDAGFEGSDEVATELAHAIHEKASGIDLHALDGDRLWNRLAVAGTVGAGAGVGFSLPSTVAEKFLRDGEESRRATVHADRLTRLMNAVSDSATNKRAPDAVKDAIAKSLGQSDEYQYIRPEEFKAAYGADEFAKAMKALGVEGEYTEAFAAGRMMKINTAALVQHGAQDPATASLFTKIRRAPDARSAEEGEGFNANAKEEAQRLSQEARKSAEEAKAAPASPAQEVRANIEAALVQAGHDPVRAKTNSIQAASLMTAMAKRSGQDPKDVYRQFLNGQIVRNLPQMIKGGSFDIVDSMINRVRKGELPTDREQHGPSLVDFLQKKGLSDRTMGGELQALKDSSKPLPGKQHLVREDGVDLDTARASAEEAGYLPAGSSINDLLKLLDDEVRGGSPAFAEGRGDPNAQSVAAALEEMHQALRGAGVDVATATNAQAREALAKMMEEGGKSLNQGDETPQFGRIEPRDMSLKFRELIKNWRKATGQPASGGPSYGDLADAADLVDLARHGKTFEQPVYHGSPHHFDKFTTDHIGSGEGAQAFGWGLYFAGSKEVAKYYRDTLGKESYRYNGKPIDPKSVEFIAAQLLMGNKGDKAQTIDDLKAGGDGEGWGDFGFNTKQTVAAVEKMDPSKIEQGGALYTAEIPDDGEYLLWDKPIAKQPESVRTALKSMGVLKGYKENLSDYGSPQGTRGANQLGSSLYEFISWKAGNNPEAASKALLAAGIKGIKYLDGTSRASAKGEHNYVIFDGADVAIRVLEQPTAKQPRGNLAFGDKPGDAYTINLFQSENYSTFSHESAHLGLEMLINMATAPGAAADLAEDLAKTKAYFKKNAKEIQEQAAKLAQGSGANRSIVDGIVGMSIADVEAIADNFQNTPTQNTPAAWAHDAMHEYFARSWEAYLFEGVAPTAALRSTFSRLKAWMVAIYRVIKTLKVNLDPEIRGVFDRMIATDDAIDDAEGREGTRAILPADAFPDLATYDEYRIAVQKERDRAEDQLQAEVIHDYRKELLKAWREQKATIRQEIANEVDSRPVYQVIAALQRGQLPDGSTLPDSYQGMKLDKAELVREWGVDVLDKLPGPGDGRANRGAHVYAAEHGMPISDVAKALGFPDQSTMIEAMIAAPDRDTLISTMTDERMRAEHPDPMLDGSLPDRATKAITGEKRGELLAREMAALGKKSGNTPAPIAVLREVARSTIDAQKGKDLRPDVYRKAAAAAGRRATEAAGKQDWAGAFVETQREALNLEMWRAARDAKEAGEKGRDYLRKLDTLDARQRIGKAGGWEFSVFAEDGSLLESFTNDTDAKALSDKNPGSTYRQTNGYQESIDVIMDGYDLRYRSGKQLQKAERLRAWIAEQEADGEQVDMPDHVVEGLDKTNWSQLTVAEQADVLAAVKKIVFLANKKNKLLKTSRDSSMKQAQQDGAAGILANRKGSVSSEVGDTLTEKAAKVVVEYMNDHVFDQYLLREMDGYKSGGVMWELIQRPRNEAATAEEIQNLKNSQAMDAAYKKWGKSLGWSRQDIKGTTLRLTTEHRISMALNWGHPEGRQRALEHLSWTKHTAEDVQAVLDSLDEKDLGLIRDLSALVNARWSDIAALERRMTGIEPVKVESLPWAANGTVMMGGYYPLKYDADKSHRGGDKATEEALKGNVATAGGRGMTRRSFTKLRAKAVKGLAIDLSLSVAGAHLNEVTHDLTHREMVRDQYALMKDGTPIAGAIIEKYGVTKLQQLKRTAGAIATRDVQPSTPMSRGIRLIRTGGTAAVFGYQLTSALCNLTGIATALTRVGPLHLLSALASVSGSPLKMEWAGNWVTEKSDFMKIRSGNNLREVSEALSDASPLGAVGKIKRWGYLPMQKIQQFVDTITWTGAYRQEMAALAAKGETSENADKMAIAVADQAVIDTQGSGRVGDLSAMQRGGELTKLMTMYFSYMNVMHNITREQGRSALEKGGTQWLASSAMILTTVMLPVVLTDIIKGVLRGDDRDEDAEGKAKRMALQQLSNAAGMMVIAREVTGTIEAGFGYSGPASLSAVKNAGDIITQAKQGEGDAAALKASLGFVGSLTGMPSRVANQTIDAWLAFEEGEDAGKAVRIMLFGKPLKDHK